MSKKLCSNLKIFSFSIFFFIALVAVEAMMIPIPPLEVTITSSNDAPFMMKLIQFHGNQMQANVMQLPQQDHGLVN